MRASILLALTLVACSSPEMPATDAGSDAPEPDAPDASAPPPWVGTLTVPFHATLDGETSTQIERVLLEDNLGTMTIVGDERSTFSPQTVDWTSADLRLVHLYATDDDDLSVSFVYCRDEQVLSIWYESLTVPLFEVEQAGVHPCTVTSGSHDIVVEQRPFDHLPEGVTLVTGVTIAGTDVALAEDGTGTITLDGIAWTMVPFGYVNCYASLCGAPGWHEVHTLLRGEGGEVGFVILYLMLDDTENVRTGYGLRFDQAGPLPSVSLPGPWHFAI